MKDFFEMNEFEFAKKLAELIPEMKEEYYYGDQNPMPEEYEMKKGVLLLCRIFNYVKRLGTRYWNFEQMAECLKLIIIENESLFLIEKAEPSYREAILREIKEGGNKQIAVIATQLLDYYNATYRIDTSFN